jgi:hypothetical protein
MKEPAKNWQLERGLFDFFQKNRVPRFYTKTSLLKKIHHGPVWRSGFTPKLITDRWSVADSNTHTSLVHTLHLPVVFVEITFPAVPASLADISSLVSNYHCKHYTSIQKPHSNVRVFASTSCHICLLCSNASFSGVNMRPAFCLS